MSRQLTTREKRLLILLGIGALIAWIGLRGDGLGLGGGNATQEIPDGPDGEPPLVRMDLLDREGVPYGDGGRNLFDYYIPPKPAPPPAPPPPPRPPPRKVERPKPPPPRTAPPPAAVQPPYPTFRYLGYLGPKERRIAVFESPEAVGELMLAGVGDFVDKEFRLVEFRFESVVFGYKDKQFEGRTTELSMSAN